jgi:hypothetical protein
MDKLFHNTYLVEICEYNYGSYEEQQEHIAKMEGEGWESTSTGGLWARFEKKELK